MRCFWKSSSEARERKAGIATTALLALLSAAGLIGCSSSALPNETAAQKTALMSFDLSKCQQVDVGLFKCPAIDKPVCNPDYAGNDVTCVRIGKDGSVYVLR